MSMTYALTDSRVMVTRCVRRSLRDPEAFFTALMLPVVLMLLFVYVFGGAFRGSGAYVDYVVPGLIVLCAGFGAGTTAVAVATDMSNGIVDRFRSMPISGSLVLVGHVVASLARNLVATALVIGVGLAVGWRPTAGPGRLGGSGGHDRVLRAGPVLAGGRGRPAGRQRRGGELVHVRAHVPALRQHGVRARPDAAVVDARVRRAPAVHAHRGDHARPVDGDTPRPARRSVTRRGSRAPGARASWPCRSRRRPGCSTTGPRPDRRRHGRGVGGRATHPSGHAFTVPPSDATTRASGW